MLGGREPEGRETGGSIDIKPVIRKGGKGDRRKREGGILLWEKRKHRNKKDPGMTRG